MHGKLLAGIAMIGVLSACAAGVQTVASERGAYSSGIESNLAMLPGAPRTVPHPWIPYAIEKGMGAEWCPEDPDDDSGETRYGGLNRACLGLLPKHLAEVMVAIPEEDIFLPAEVRSDQVRRPQPYLALPGRGQRPDFMASVDILEGILLRSFEGTTPADTVYLVVGPFKCIDDDPLVAREGEYLVEAKACQAAHAETRLYKWSTLDTLHEVTKEYLVAPAMTPAEQALTAPLKPYLDIRELDYVPVMRWTISLRDVSFPGGVDDHDYDPVDMPDWVPDTRRLGSALHLGFVVWTGENFEVRQRVPRTLWPLPRCNLLRPDSGCGEGGRMRGGDEDPFVDEEGVRPYQRSK